MIVATAAGDGLRSSAANPHPTAAPTSGPKMTFCGRTPRSPASKPVAVPIWVGPALVVLPASQPSGATNAPVDKIRYHNGWISIPRRPALATALAPASNVAPPIVDNAVTILFQRGARKTADQRSEYEVARLQPGKIWRRSCRHLVGHGRAGRFTVAPPAHSGKRTQAKSDLRKRTDPRRGGDTRGETAHPPLPDGHLSIAAKRSSNREDIGSAATDATWRSPTGVLSPVRGPALGRWRG